MKQTIKIMSLLFLAIITLTTFSSCERTVFDHENELIGTWECNQSCAPPLYGGKFIQYVKYISFFEEGAGIMRLHDDGDDVIAFVYSMEEDTFKVWDDWESEGFTFKIEKSSSKKLVLSSEGVTKEFKKRN
ncbi:MAG: hypothetical protein U0J38_05740 [Bacteroidales bacterium]|nr:hypothetical protein [Bacteroidales bacterium]